MINTSILMTACATRQTFRNKSKSVGELILKALNTSSMARSPTTLINRSNTWTCKPMTCRNTNSFKQYAHKHTHPHSHIHAQHCSLSRSGLLGYLLGTDIGNGEQRLLHCSPHGFHNGQYVLVFLISRRPQANGSHPSSATTLHRPASK